MHYRPEDGHDLPHNPFKAIIAPRPIAWVSTRDEQGRANLAPYSFFNGVADAPPMIMFAVTGRKIGRDEVKDTLANIRHSQEFAVNVVGYDMREAMNISSGNYAPGDDEFAMAGLEVADCVEIDAPRIANAPATLECRLHQAVELPCDHPGQMNVTVFGRVVHIHLNDDCIRDGIFDITRHRPLARCGYMDYAVVNEVFSMRRPT